MVLGEVIPILIEQSGCLDTHLKFSADFLPNILECCTLGVCHLSTGA